MATVAIKILKNQKKRDGTYNVKIRITHNRQVCYINTHYYVSDDQLSADFTLKDSSIHKQLHDTLRKYRIAIGRLGNLLKIYSAFEIKDYLIDADKDVDFIKFSNQYIDDLVNIGRKGSASTLKTVVYSLIDYFKRDTISTLEINGRELIQYEKYLRSERKISRPSNRTTLTRIVKGMGDTGIHNHMRDLRILFKAAMRFYNNPEFNDFKIPYCPFDHYKLVEPTVTRKRNLKLPQIRIIRDSQASPGSRAEIGRDMFMLSFYLCGMNAIDIYDLRPENIVKGRIEYYRSKTKRRRKDNSFISIKIIKAAEPLLEKYVGKLHLRFADSSNLDRAVNKGLKQLFSNTDFSDITFYWARHSFGNIARNKCRMSKDDVALTLNHVDQYYKTTDIYLEKDWKIIDEVQKSVIKKLNKDINIAKRQTEYTRRQRRINEKFDPISV